MNKIFFYTNHPSDNQIFETYQSTANELPYLQFIMSKQGKYGSKEKPYFVDMESEGFEILLDFTRNKDEYIDYIPSEWTNVIEKLVTQKQFDDNMCQTVDLDVGGVLFRTSVNTLQNIPYFDAYINRWTFDDKKEVFLDRNPKAFRYILSHARNPAIKIPNKYSYEMVYFGFTEKKNKIIVENMDKQFFDNDSHNIDYQTVNENALTGHLSNHNYTTNNPQITFMKHIYRRHTTFMQNRVYTKPSNLQCPFTLNDATPVLDFIPNVSDIGDTFSKLNLVLDIPNLPEDMQNDNRFPFNLIDTIQIKLNDLVIDTLTGSSIKMLLDTHTHGMSTYLSNCSVSIPILWSFIRTEYLFPMCKLISQNRTFSIHVQFAKEFFYYPLQCNASLTIDTMFLSAFEKNRFNVGDHEFLLLGTHEHTQDIEEDTCIIDFCSFDDNVTRLVKSIHFAIEDNNGEYIDCLDSATLTINDRIINKITPIDSHINYQNTPGTKQPHTPIYYIPFCFSDLFSKSQPSGTLDLRTTKLNIHTKHNGNKIKLWLSYNKVLMTHNGAVGFIDLNNNEPGVHFQQEIPGIPDEFLEENE